MVRKLRDREGKNGLVLANGGCLTYQHVMCLSSQSPTRDRPYPEKNLLPDSLKSVMPHVDVVAEGEAIIEVCMISLLGSDSY